MLSKERSHPGAIHIQTDLHSTAWFTKPWKQSAAHHR